MAASLPLTDLIGEASGFGFDENHRLYQGRSLDAGFPAFVPPELWRTGCFADFGFAAGFWTGLGASGSVNVASAELLVELWATKEAASSESREMFESWRLKALVDSCGLEERSLPEGVESLSLKLDPVRRRGGV